MSMQRSMQDLLLLTTFARKLINFYRNYLSAMLRLPGNETPIMHVRGDATTATGRVSLQSVVRECDLCSRLQSLKQESKFTRKL